MPARALYSALLWLAQPLYLLRRLVRFASEDIGLADPQALVQVVNQVFAAAELREPAGAFQFGDAAGASPLPFLGVQAKGRAERFVTAQGDVPALTAVADAAPAGAHGTGFTGRFASTW